MNKKIIEKYNMFTNVNTVFTDHAAAISKVSALDTQVAKFKTEYAMLAAPMQALELDSTGNAKAKKEAKAVLSRIGGIVCGAMKSYALDINDSVLLTKVDYSPSALLLKRDLELQNTGQALYDLSNGLAAQLSSYGIQETELNEMKAAVDRFTLLNPKVRAVKVDNKTLRKELFEKVEAVDFLLRTKLDNGMMVMEFTAPSFYELYRNVRRNYSDGVRHRKPEEAATKTINYSEAPDLSVALKGIVSQPQENGVPA